MPTMQKLVGKNYKCMGKIINSVDYQLFIMVFFLFKKKYKLNGKNYKFN